MYCYGFRAPECILVPKQDHGPKSTADVNVVHKREVEDQQTQIEGDIKVENEGPEQKEHDWRNQVKVDVKLDTYGNKFMDVMTEFESLWDGRLGCISPSKHCIE